MFSSKKQISHWSKDIERRAVAFNWQTVNQKNQFIILFKKLSCKRTITKIASIWKGTIWKTLWHLAISKAEDRFCRNFTAAKKLKLINKKTGGIEKLLFWRIGELVWRGHVCKNMKKIPVVHYNYQTKFFSCLLQFVFLKIKMQWLRQRC